ncbi:alkaline phosphatase D family protein [Aquirhabdus parva]|uniref:Alkaline phosphatase n=1 Tax=Aquirhabdus parva TaxID=2283318 RepID=A0A345P7T2_9GAMM|nr:alkaline phosphatase D family protein [Aquirhabdus parva]AXI03341.1 alkaline phosphatase [Aquirhabdus parva]
MTSRRSFISTVIQSAGFLTIASALPIAGCGSSDDAPVNLTPKGSFLFGQGVASGDPRTNSVILWTRCIPATGSQDVNLSLQIATDSEFKNALQSIPVTALAKYDNTVRVKVTGLTADQVYYYRFTAGSDSSNTGTTKTLPPVTSTRDIRFAWLSCQDWSINHWAGLTLLAKEQLDFVIHVGDYIYETVGAAFQTGQVEAAHGPITLPSGGLKAKSGVYANTIDDYRTLYRTYRGDTRLQSIHQNFPMIAIWDDHEFSDDCWQDHQTYTNENKQETTRRRNATQAWAEYQPIDWTDVQFQPDTTTGFTNIRIYRDFRVGQNMHLVMTDERLYRDDHIVDEATFAKIVGHDSVNGDDSVGTRYFVPQPVLGQFEQTKTTALGRVPSILGTAQTQWFKDTLKNTDATWKIWGNEVALSRMWLDLRAAEVPAQLKNRYVLNCDAWDGYPTAKQELLSYLVDNKIKNVVAITGDLHAFQASVVRNIAENGQGTPVLVDFLAAGVSSSSFYTYLKPGFLNSGIPAIVSMFATPTAFDDTMKLNNPDFAYVDHDAQGYAIATVGSAQMSVTFYKTAKLNSDGSLPANILLKKTQFTVAKDTTTIVVKDNA